MATNIFDTRHILRQTPKMGNRFLLTADPTQLNNIVNGSATATPGTNSNGNTTTFSSDASQQPISKLKKMNQLAGGNDEVFGSLTAANKKTVDVLNLSLLSCTIPAFEFESAEVSHFNDSVKHITKFSASNDMSAVFYDYINGSSAAIMLAWQSAVGFKLTGAIGYKKHYTCDMDLFVYGPNRPAYKVYKDATLKSATEKESGGYQDNDDVKYELLMQLRIINAYPRSVDIGDFSYDSAEIKKVTVQFGYDMIIPYKNKVRDKINVLEVGAKDTAPASTSTADDIETKIFITSKRNVRSGATDTGAPVAGDTIGTGA
jgi:hypothetical protein